MKRITHLGLALLAVLAIAATTAGSASAGCIGCKTQLSSAGGGPFTGAGGPFEILATNGTQLLRCEAAHSLAPTADGSGFNDLIIGLTGCTSHSGSACTSGELAPGEVTTAALHRELGFINGRAGTVGVEQTPESSEDVFATFTCGATHMTIRGGVAGSITPINKLVSGEGHFTVAFEATKGKQALSNLEGHAVLGLELTEDGGAPKPVALSDLDLVAAANPTEIIATGPAPQSPPEYGRCLKAVPTQTGEYSDAHCRNTVAPGTGKFEWIPAPLGSGFHGSFTSTTKTATLKTSVGNVVCKTSAGSGEILGAKTATEQVTFTGCELAKVACASGGDALDPSNGPEVAGAIVTKPLSLSLIEPSPGVAWTGFTAVDGPSGFQATFHCGEERFFEVQGMLAGVTAPVNKMSTKSTVSLTEAGGEQALITLVSSGGEFVQAPGGTLELTSATVLSAEKLEIKTR